MDFLLKKVDGTMKCDCRDAARLAAAIENWLKQHVKEAGAAGGIVGLSGGIDSAVVAALLKRAFGSEMLAVLLPCGSMAKDKEDALLVADTFALPCREVELTPVYDAFLRVFGVPISPMASANIKPRLRMNALYALAQTNGLLVCGTGNKAEILMGYFTKYGDGGCDLLPLGDLLKCEVRSLARFLGVPAEIIEKAPSAGLWEGQTDEGEMGMTYEEIDMYIATGKGDERVRTRLERMKNVSAHKRATPPVCIPF